MISFIVTATVSAISASVTQFCDRNLTIPFLASFFLIDLDKVHMILLWWYQNGCRVITRDLYKLARFVYIKKVQIYFDDGTFTMQ